MLLLTGHRGRVRSLAFSADGGKLASAAGKGEVVSLWELGRKRRRNYLKGHQWPVTAVAFAPAGPLLASADGMGYVKLWDAAEGRLVRDVGPAHRCYIAPRFTPDGRALRLGLFSASGGELRYLDVASGDLLPEPVVRVPAARHAYMGSHVALSPAGDALALAGHYGDIELWGLTPVREGPPLPRIPKIYALAFSPDGKLLAVADGHVVRLWDTATGAERGTLKGHTRMVTAVAFTPDGRLLASASTDGQVKLWDLASGAQRGGFDWQVGPVTALALAPDGMRGACGGHKGPIAVWDLDP
jgi:WD40 repeat protein